MKKLLSVLLVVAMLFGMATAAFAYTDVTATAQTGPVEKLNALGILKGYADGTFKPENAITRAEFAAVIVRALGLESAAVMIGSPTKFADVTADQAWAYGYINIASAKGIIKGDPNGKFRPNDKVSYAEAITMLLRAGGWDAACSTMDWPAGFVMKAVEFGLTKDVTFDGNASANRGAIAVMTYNALAMPTAKWNDTVKVYENDTLFGAKFLNATEKTVVVTATPKTNSALKANEITTVDGAAMSVPAGTDVNALLGHDVRVIKTGTTTYAYIKDAQAAAKVVTGEFVSLVGTTLTLDIDDTNTTFTTIASPVTVRNNAAVVPVTNPLTAGDTITAYKDADGNVRFINATSFSVWMRATGIDVKDVNSAPANAVVVGTNKYNVVANTVITRDGKAATFADLKAGDIVYIAATGAATPFTALVVDAYSATATGAIGALSFTTSGVLTVTLGSTVYPVATSAQISVNGGAAATLNAAAIASRVGYAGTAYLTKDGKIAYLKADTTALIGYYVSKNTTDGSTITMSIRGANQVFNVASAYKSTVLGATYATTSLYQITQAADGTVILVSGALSKSDNFKVLSIDTTNKLITVRASGGTGAISTLAYDTATFGLIGGTWANMSNLAVNSIISYVDDGGSPAKAVYYETYSAVPGSGAGRFVGYVVNADTTTTVFLEVKGAVVSYTSNAAWAPNVGGGEPALATLTDKIVTVNLTGGKVSSVLNVTWGTAATIVSISGTTYTLDTTGTLSVEDFGSASVYLTNGTVKALSDLKVGDSVKILKPSTTVTFVQKQ